MERCGDRYASFAELSLHEEEGVDFRITVRFGASGVVVAAPHGGGIEPGTSEIAQAIAAGEHSLYCFEGLNLSDNKRLHVTSTKFDEPIGMRTIERAHLVLAIHGCEGSGPIVYIGGLDLELRKNIAGRLKADNFEVGVHAELTGNDPMNLCNRGTSGGGVQLEISSGLRRLMFADLSRQGRKKPTPIFHRFVSAVRRALSEN